MTPCSRSATSPTRSSTPTRQGSVSGVRVTYAVEHSPLDTAGAIRFAAEHAGIDETFVAVNGDVLTDFDIGALVDLHRRRGAAGTIALTPVDDPSAFGVVPTDEEGRVTAFIEKPPRDEAPTNLINAGIYVLEPTVLGSIAPDLRVSIERETFPALVEERSLYALGSDAYWLDTGTPDAYLRAHYDLVGGRRPGPPAPEAELDPSLGPEVWTDRRRVGGKHCHRPEPAGSGGNGRRERGRGRLGDRPWCGHRGGRIGHRLGAAGRGAGGGQRIGRRLDHRGGCHHRPAMRHPRPVGGRGRGGDGFGDGGRRRTRGGRWPDRARPRDRWCRLHRLDTGGSLVGGGPHRRRDRRPLDRLARQPGRRPGSARAGGSPSISSTSVRPSASSSWPVGGPR